MTVPDTPATGDTPQAPQPPEGPQRPSEPEVEDHGEDLGAGGKKALEAERRARREAEARLKELEPLAKAAAERAEAEKSELTKANETLAAERDARAKAEAALLRHEVAAAKGVSPNLARLLTGTTKEEIEEAADVLLAEMGGGAKPTVAGRPTERVASGRPSTSLDDLDPMALIAKARGNPQLP